MRRSALEWLQARSGSAPAEQAQAGVPHWDVREQSGPTVFLCPDRSTYPPLLLPSSSCSDVPLFMRSPPSSPGAINHRSRLCRPWE